MPATRHMPPKKLEDSFLKKILKDSREKILTFQDLLRQRPVCHPITLKQDALKLRWATNHFSSMSAEPVTLSPIEIKDNFVSHYSGHSYLEIMFTVIITLKL